MFIKSRGLRNFKSINTIFTEGFLAYKNFVAVLSVIGIIYGAIVAIAQIDIKKLIAYSSVSHMGYVMLGISAGGYLSIEGAIIQMITTV